MANKKAQKIQPKRKQQEDEDAENTGGMSLEKEDIQLIYNALKAYTPKAKEEHLLSVLLEEFEEILAVDFAEINY